MIQLSTEQRAVVEAVKKAVKTGLSNRRTNTLIRVDARAGCGKTTTAIQAIRETGQANRGVKCGLFVFNNAIAREIEGKTKDIPWVEVRTAHSKGMQILKYGLLAKGIRDAQLNQKKGYDLANLTWDRNRDALTRGLRVSKRVWVKALVNGYQMFRMTTGKKFSSSAIAFDALAMSGWLDRYPELKDEALTAYHTQLKELIKAGNQQLLGAVNSETGQYTPPDEPNYDFEDCLYFPATGRVKIPEREKYNFVVIDEAQDSSQSRIRLAFNLLLPGGVLMYVGDEAQSIYGFAGASTTAMGDFQIHAQEQTVMPFQIEQYSISTTRRCPKVIVEKAKVYAPDFTATEDAPDGHTISMGYQEFLNELGALKVSNKAGCVDTTFVLCRNVAPLIKVYAENYHPDWRLLLDWNQITDSIKDLSGYPANESHIGPTLAARLDAESAKPEAKQNDFLIESLTESLAIWNALYHHSDEETLKRLARFGTTQVDETSQVTFLTCHKSKGKEADVVYLLGENCFMPSKAAQRAINRTEAMQQEHNLIYVSYTRAKQILISVVCDPADFTPDPKPKPQQSLEATATAIPA